MSLPPDDPTPPAHAGDAWSAADWQELANFLGREGSPAALAATARRLQTDAHFATLAAPLLTVWAMPLPGADSAFDLDAGWAALLQQAAVAPRGHRPPWYRRSWQLIHPQWVIAALLTLIIGYTALYLNDRPRERALHYYAATGVAHTVALADGSRVTLAPGATIVTDGVAAGSQTSVSRTVHLDGSATFAVHSDPAHPFVVESHDIAAVAIGTVFHVTADPILTSTVRPAMPSAAGAQPFATDVQVSVTSGKVLVQRRTGAGTRETVAVLGPGQETSVHTFTRYFKAGWAAGAAHKSVADAYLEYQAMKAADSASAARPAP